MTDSAGRAGVPNPSRQACLWLGGRPGGAFWPPATPTAPSAWLALTGDGTVFNGRVQFDLSGYAAQVGDSFTFLTFASGSRMRNKSSKPLMSVWMASPDRCSAPGPAPARYNAQAKHGRQRSAHNLITAAVRAHRVFDTVSLKYAETAAGSLGSYGLSGS